MLAILQQWQYYTVLVYLAGICYVAILKAGIYIVLQKAKQQGKLFGYKSGHGTHASKHYI